MKTTKRFSMKTPYFLFSENKKQKTVSGCQECFPVFFCSRKQKTVLENSSQTGLKSCCVSLWIELECT